MATIREALRRVMGERRSQKIASFRLEYTPARGKPVIVGYLKFENGWWSFEYGPDYRHRSDLRPIEGFDDLRKVYRSRALFPFFAVRVPDQHRPDVRRRLEDHHIHAPDTSDLLRMFGRRAVASPAFELIEA
jgi:HipA-like protein